MIFSGRIVSFQLGKLKELFQFGILKFSPILAGMETVEETTSNAEVDLTSLKKKPLETKAKAERAKALRQPLQSGVRFWIVKINL